MMRYTREPKCARPVHAIEGLRPTDRAPVGLHVTEHAGVYYTTWFIDGATVYRRRYSGRNVHDLLTELSALRAGLIEIQEAGVGIQGEAS